MKLPKNLRSGFMQEDVEDYLYELLPPRDTVITRNGRLCCGAQRSHHRACRGEDAGFAGADFRGQKNFRTRLGDWILHDLASAGRWTAGRNYLYG